jgi:hypothetical protein
MIQRVCIVLAVVSVAACGTEPDDTISRIVLSPAEVELLPNEATALSFEAFTRKGDRADPSQLQVTWSSTGPGVATVTSSGVVRALAAGAAEIRLVIGTASAATAVNVSPNPPSPVVLERTRGVCTSRRPSAV